MITAVRSAVICDKVERRANGLTDYLGIHGAVLLAQSLPGLLEVWIALHLDVDKRQTRGRVSLASADLGLMVPFDFATGRGMSVIAFPLFIPIQAAHTLTLTIQDDDRRDRPFRFKWALGFAPGAKALEPHVAATVVEEAAEANARVLASLVKPAAKH
ncbi:hypothetical protein CFHF_20030 [Caulobacter flavus]|uniref:Uncharacterized protein n=2 Tax=cellular organisms TaxID=131567 RepID=B9TLB1_RICCO|nr:hypothetical protein [Caulobacter flavus]AYV48547.1 hypothetical protein C1707_21035 [Caulobacter flavus]EEF23352.1 conserved hypothetical protein [Ricinus communis]PLR08737.1 hypothetical protein CFHF_20030 [Caulobacter flavus]